MGILTTIKQLLGIPEESTHFDSDITIHINTIFSVMAQLGLVPDDGFFITGDSETWDDLLGTSSKYAYVKSYVFLRVKMLFDPPSSSSLMESMNRTIAELEWRLSISDDMV